MPRKDLPKRLIAYLGTLGFARKGRAPGNRYEFCLGSADISGAHFHRTSRLAPCQSGRGAGKSTLVGAICCGRRSPGRWRNARGHVVIAAPSYQSKREYRLRRAANSCGRSRIREARRLTARFGRLRIAEESRQHRIQVRLGSRDPMPRPQVGLRCTAAKAFSRFSMSRRNVWRAPRAADFMPRARTGLGKIPGSSPTRNRNASRGRRPLVQQIAGPANAGMSDYSATARRRQVRRPVPAARSGTRQIPVSNTFLSLLANTCATPKPHRMMPGSGRHSCRCRLNLGTSTVCAARIDIRLTDWEAIEGDAARRWTLHAWPRTCGDVGALTAFAGYLAGDGAIGSARMFPYAVPDLLARGKRDHVGDAVRTMRGRWRYRGERQPLRIEYRGDARRSD